MLPLCILLRKIWRAINNFKSKYNNRTLTGSCQSKVRFYLVAGLVEFKGHLLQVTVSRITGRWHNPMRSLFFNSGVSLIEFSAEVSEPKIAGSNHKTTHREDQRVVYYGTRCIPVGKGIKSLIGLHSVSFSSSPLPGTVSQLPSFWLKMTPWDSHWK